MAEMRFLSKIEQVAVFLRAGAGKARCPGGWSWPGFGVSGKLDGTPLIIGFQSSVFSHRFSNIIGFQIDISDNLCMNLCMPSKTISVDLDAYERLRRARQRPGESFSRVIKRASWASPLATGAALLERLEGSSLLSDETLDRLEKAQLEDLPPPRP